MSEEKMQKSRTGSRNCPFKGRKFKASETVQWMHDLIWKMVREREDRKEIRPMVHTLVPMSVKIKIKNFETPARLINHMELSCAVGWRAVRLRFRVQEELPEQISREFVKVGSDTIYSGSAVDEKLKVLIRDYIYKRRGSG